jgi:hypothetical protein
MTEKTTKDNHRLERKAEKGQGRDRRAELLLDTQAKEKARHDALEGRQVQIEETLADLVPRVVKLEQLATAAATGKSDLEQRVAKLEQLVAAATATVTTKP